MPKIVNHEERREFIARACAEIIAEQGLEQATIREIAQRTGFSKGVIEHYFEDKAHIIDMALDWITRRYLQRERRAVAGKQGLAALKARLTFSLPLTRESQQEWKVRLRFWSIAAQQNQLQRTPGKILMLTREMLAENIEEAKALGEVWPELDTMHATNMLIQLSTGLSCNALIAPEYYNKRYIREMIDNVISDLRNAHSNPKTFDEVEAENTAASA